MKSVLIAAAAFIAAAPLSAAAPAQQSARSSGGSGGLLGRASGLLGGGLGGIGQTTAGNAAGLLGYCVKNKLLGGSNATGAGSVLGRLTGRDDVTESPGYQAGQQGRVQTGNGRSFSLAGVREQVKAQACDLVLNRARSFL